jgi:signal transduction histidine kinase
MQQTESLRGTAHEPDSAAMMNATAGLTTHEPKHETKAKTASPASEDARLRESDRITPERIRTSPNLTSPELMRAKTLAAALVTLRSESETLTEVAHDARNMVTALGLYCEFLEEPGVLATPFLHYGQELRLVAAASRRLVEKIVAIDHQTTAQTSASISAQAAAKLAILVPDLFPSFVAGRITPADTMPSGLTATELSPVTGDVESGAAQQARTATAAAGTQRESGTFSNPNRRWDLLPTVPVANLAAELAVNHNLLAALAGPSITLTVHAEGCARPVWLSGEDLTRVLVNLVKNSAEAMLSGGLIHIDLREQPAEPDAAGFLLLTVEDNGPGIPAEAVETIFASGFTSHGTKEGKGEGAKGDCIFSHRGLGLTISRSIVEGAGGRITAANREQGGARFALELPLRQAN